MAQWDRFKEKLPGSLSDAGKVVSIGDRVRAPWCAPLRQVEAYWAALRQGRIVPARSDIDPRGIEGALEFAFIAEYLAPGHARLRIAGMHLCDLMGMEVRGMPLSALISPVSRTRLGEAISSAFDAPAQVELALTAERRLGKPALNARMILLPMTDDFGDVSRILGCLVSDGDIGRAPRRFEIAQCTATPLTATKEALPLVSAAPKSRVSEQAETQRKFRSGPVPYLSLVESDT